MPLTPPTQDQFRVTAIVIAARPKFDSWRDRWATEVLVYRPSMSAQWRSFRYADRGAVAAFYDSKELADEAALNLNAQSQLALMSIEDPMLRQSLQLRASKALQATQRLRDEESQMLLFAKQRMSDLIFDPSTLQLSKGAENYRLEIEQSLSSYPYLRLISFKRGSRHFFTHQRSDGVWAAPSHATRRGVEIGRRARIADGFGLNALEHWGKTKATIRQMLLPRANHLLMQASVKRMLDQALADGKRVLVWGAFVFWHEGRGVGWVIKERASTRDGSDAEALWKEGKIVSTNHGRIVVLPYVKDNGDKVAGHTKNAPHDGKALPRHPDDILEIPFEELDGDLMLGLLGELRYE